MRQTLKLHSLEQSPIRCHRVMCSGNMNTNRQVDYSFLRNKNLKIMQYIMIRSKSGKSESIKTLNHLLGFRQSGCDFQENAPRIPSYLNIHVTTQCGKKCYEFSLDA